MRYLYHFISLLYFFVTLHANTINAQDDVSTLDMPKVTVKFEELKGKIDTFYKQNICDSVLIYSNDLLDMSIIEYTPPLTSILINRMSCEHYFKKYDELLKTALLFEQVIESQPYKAINYFLLWRQRGTAALGLGDVENGNRALSKSLEYAFEIKLPATLMIAHSDLFLLQKEYLKDFEKAIYHAHKAHEYAEESLDKKKRSRVLNYYYSLNNLGSVYSITGNLDTALIYHLKGQDFLKQNTEIFGDREIALNQLNVSQTMLATGQVKDTLQLLQETLEIVRKSKDNQLLCSALLSVVETYIDRGLKVEAKALAYEAEAYIEPFLGNQDAIKLYNLIAELAEESDPLEALEYRLKASELEESIAHEDIKNTVKNTQLTFSQKVLEHQKALQDEKLRQQQILMIMILLLCFTTGLAYIIIYRKNRKHLRVNRALRQTQTELEESNRRLNHFVHSISHDVNSKLEYIIMTSKQVKEAERGSDSKLHQYYFESQETALWLKKYCRELLIWSDKDGDSQQVVAVALRPLVAEILGTYRTELQGQAFQLKVGELPNVEKPKALLKQVLQNLIDNAIKYTRHQKVPKLEISATEQLNRWVIFVKDNGIGVCEEEHCKIFEGKRNDDGHGIGLSFVKNILVEYEESIWVEVNEWGGSTFNFTISDTSYK